MNCPNPIHDQICFQKSTTGHPGNVPIGQMKDSVLVRTRRDSNGKKKQQRRR